MTERDPLTIAALDALPPARASALLESCCGAEEWVRHMVARRPFRCLATVLRAADDVWWSLGPADWLEAFGHHPRIGEREAQRAQSAHARAWSAEEQRGATTTEDELRDALAEGNREYERRFGHIYIVCATGRSAGEMLSLLRDRLENDPATELRLAAGEQAKITHLRLRKLLRED